MSDRQNPFRSTGNLRGATEQLPSFQKRSLKTGGLQRTETAPLKDSSTRHTSSLNPTVETVKNFTPIETPVQPSRVTAPIAPKQDVPDSPRAIAVNSSEEHQELQVPTEKIERSIPPLPTLPTEAVRPGVVAGSTLKTEPVKAPFSAGEAQIGTFGGYYETTPEPKESAIKGFLIFFIPLLLLVATLAGVFLYVPALREKIPPRLASALRIKQAATTPVATLQEYRVSVDPKENIATISGVVTNISEDQLTDLQVEIVLFRREDIRQTETRNIPLSPAQIGINQTATYELKVSARSYQQMKVTKLLSGQTELVIKKLEPIDKATPSDYETLQKKPQPSGKKTDPNEVYDGSISFK